MQQRVGALQLVRCTKKNFMPDVIVYFETCLAIFWIKFVFLCDQENT